MIYFSFGLYYLRHAMLLYKIAACVNSTSSDTLNN